VCEKIIKPATEAKRCAYIQIADKACVGKATVFVSHAWKYDINDVFTVMLEYADTHPNTFFWFDLFCNNQHQATSHPFEWWCNTFQQNIQSIGAVLLVMAPWQDPIPLRRAW
jgi:hypothetical protein